jgi:glycerol-3-phosphate dehydrogenase subunit C
VLDLRGHVFAELAGGVYDIFEWIREALWDQLAQLKMSAIDATVLYHPSCQLLGQGMGLPALEILGQIPGLKVQIARSDCCGGAGSYALKQETYPLAVSVGDELFRHIEEVRPAWVLSDTESCRWWIEDHTGVPTKHPIEILAMAMKLENL